MRKTTFAILLLSATSAALTASAGDHLDGPATTASPMADAADLYAWTSSDGTKLNLILTVSPVDDGTRAFGPSLVYVFHVASHSSYGMPGTDTKIVCKFQSDTNHACWVGTSDYVSGDASVTTGITSADGKVRLFAGRRSDPFFFNLDGLRALVKSFTQSVTGVTFDQAGCPSNLTDASASAFRSALSSTAPTRTAPCKQGVPDCFQGMDVKAIVLQVDLSLLNAGSNKLLSVWASTHSAT